MKGFSQLQNFENYADLIKPSWAPPAWLFGPVWTVLYAIIIVSFGYVVRLYAKGAIPFSVLLPFILNIFFNLIFTPIQFGLKNNFFASTDILLVFITFVWALIVIHPYSRSVSYANVPYLMWVMFATVLQLTITFLNK